MPEPTAVCSRGTDSTASVRVDCWSTPASEPGHGLADQVRGDGTVEAEREQVARRHQQGAGDERRAVADPLGQGGGGQSS